MTVSPRPGPVEPKLAHAGHFAGGGGPATTAWPITRAACDGLVNEIRQLREDFSEMTSQGLEEGIIGLTAARTTKRIEALTALLDRCEVVDDTLRPAIGRRTTLGTPDGSVTSFEIVVPGTGESGEESVPADSPLGQAVLASQTGDVVEVDARDGRLSLTIVSVG
ncbi:MAG: GreA/GreB family elongation factor [Chloroflexota bacterium]